MSSCLVAIVLLTTDTTQMRKYVMYTSSPLGPVFFEAKDAADKRQQSSLDALNALKF